MLINSKAEDDNDSVKNYASDSGRKAYAVAILAQVWMGAKLPKEFVAHAKRIRRQMLKDGTWASA